MDQQLIAIQRIQKKPENGSKWNNHIIIWSIYANKKNYSIELEMNYLSSKKVVKVNGIPTHTAMVTFGYESNFLISTQLQGRIKQNGVKNQFQLFINNCSYSDLQKKRPTYQPLKFPNNNETNISQKEADENFKVQKPIKKIQPVHHIIQIKPFQQNNKNVGPPAPAVQLTELQKIKNTQKELMKILKANKKKEEQKKI